MKFVKLVGRNPFFGLICALILLFAALSISTRGEQITAIVPEGPYPGLVAAGDLDVSWASLSSVTDATFVSTGRELVLIRYPTDATLPAGTTASVTLESQYDEYQRKADIIYTVTVEGTYAFWMGNKTGWADSDGVATISASNSALEAAVLTIRR